MFRDQLNWRRLVAALGIGVAAEAVLFGGYFMRGGGEKVPALWTAFTSTQEPGWHLMKWLTDTMRPGIEEQIGYVYVIPLVQWLVYTVLTYLALSLRARRRSAT